MEIKPSNIIIFETDIQNTNIFPISGYLTPPRIATAYNIPDNTGTGITVGIISVGGGFLQSDFDSSMAAMGLTTATINTILIDGANGAFGINASSDIENTLDLYCVGGMVPDATINIYISLGTQVSTYNALMNAIDDNCDVISISWGIPEDEGAGEWLEVPLALAASKGITVLASAGDTGSADPDTLVKSVFYPASSINAIAVGGSHLTVNTLTNARISETVENTIVDPGFSFGWGSGGGISTLTNLPPWQTGLTYKTYNSTTAVTSGPFSLTMRGLPDITAPMNGYSLYYNSSIVSIGGTSASSPIMAGMVARLKALTGSSKSSLSYNQLFYSNTSSFYDITTGTNATEIPQGYAATVGWDAVTGLGSPNGTLIYNNMLNDSSLSSLVISSVTLNPSFNSNITSYTSTVPNTVLAVQVTPVSGESTATITVNGISTSSGSTSDFIILNLGTNVIPVTVTSLNSISTTTYTTTITRSLSTNSTLFYLSISNGTLVPPFAGATTSYINTVSNTVTSVTVLPVANDSSSTIVINGTPVVNSTTSSAITLVTGTNVIQAVVTAQDRNHTSTYTVTVTRSAPLLSTDASLSSLTASSGTLSPSFASSTTLYLDTVTNITTSMVLTPIVNDINASLIVKYGNLTTGNTGTVSSGNSTSPIPLVVGNNSVYVKVTAQAGNTLQYNIITTRLPAVSTPSTDASLSGLIMSQGTLTPTFSTSTFTYTDTITHATTSLTITPTATDSNATIKVNGITQASGSPTSAIRLNVGDNLISVLVTAQDGVTTDIYSITATRGPSSDATLSSLSITNGTLVPTFSSGTQSYTDTVLNSIAFIAVAPTTTDIGATVTVNGIAVNSGFQSGAIGLNTGTTNVTIIVTAQDGSTTKTYLVTVTRAAPLPFTNSLLGNLTISSGTLVPTFSKYISAYTDTVNNSVSSITVTPTADDPTATIKVNGLAVTSGSTSSSINLYTGTNTIRIIGTAQDGITSSTYTVSVTRLTSTDATLSSLTISTGTLIPAFTSGTISYENFVDYTVTSLTVTPTINQPNATVKVNGTSIASGTTSSVISLSVGSNTILITATAQNGVTTKSYTVSVFRAFAPILPLESRPSNATIHNFVNDGISLFSETEYITTSTAYIYGSALSLTNLIPLTSFPTNQLEVTVQYTTGTFSWIPNDQLQVTHYSITTSTSTVFNTGTGILVSTGTIMFPVYYNTSTVVLEEFYNTGTIVLRNGYKLTEYYDYMVINTGTGTVSTIKLTSEFLMPGDNIDIVCFTATSSASSIPPIVNAFPTNNVTYYNDDNFTYQVIDNTVSIGMITATTFVNNFTYILGTDFDNSTEFTIDSSNNLVIPPQSYPGVLTYSIPFYGNQVSPNDLVEVYYGGRLLRKTGIFVQDTSMSYDSPMTSFTTATVDTVLDLPTNTKILGTAYITLDTNQVWVYTRSREFDSISGYVYRGLNYLPPEFSINALTQEITLNIPEALIPHEPVRIDIVKKEFSVNSEWNDIDPMNPNQTLSIMDSTSTQARFLQARPAELPDNYYYGGSQDIIDASGSAITVGGLPLGGL